MNIHRRPLFPFAIAYICGIVCAVQMNLHPAAAFGLMVSGCLAGVVAFRKAASRMAAVVLAGVFLLGFMRAAEYRHVPTDDVSGLAKGEKVRLTGRVVSDPEPFEDRVRFVVSVKEVETYLGRSAPSGRVMVTLYRPWEGTAAWDDSSYMPSFGDVIRIRGRLRKPSPPTNPGVHDYRKYLARKRVYSTLSAGMDEVSVVETGGTSMSRLASTVKQALTSQVRDLFPPMHGKLLLGILLGNYSDLPAETQAAFMRSGTMHLLAASGYNCGVILLIFGYVMRRLTTPRSSMYMALIVLLWAFTMVAGPSPSIVRAATMSSAFLAAYLLWRTSDMLNIVLFAALLILGGNPLSLYDIGFQLSFCAVLAIVLVLPLVDARVREWFAPRKEGGRPPGMLTSLVLHGASSITLAVTLSAATALGTWPITAYYFNYISLVSLPANALTALLVIFLSACGIGALFFGVFVDLLGRVFAMVGSLVAVAMLGVVTHLGSLPWASVSVISPSAAFVIIYYAVLLGVLEYAYRKAASGRQLVCDIGSRTSDAGNLAASSSKH